MRRDPRKPVVLLDKINFFLPLTLMRADRD